MKVELSQRYAGVRERLSAAARAAGRDPAEVGLVAVSKTQTASAVRALAACGQRDFGENYLQEALAKQAALADLSLAWHFIGPLQSNKTREVAEAFDWVHSVDRLKIARRLSDQRPADRPPLQVCLQVNLSGEASKSGCTAAELPALCAAVAALPRLQLRGLMTLPAPVRAGDDPRRPFATLRQLLQQLQTAGHPLDTLSMGMSDDVEAAIAEGAHWVRIGTALFGARPSPLPPAP